MEALIEMVNMTGRFLGEADHEAIYRAPDTKMTTNETTYLVVPPLIIVFLTASTCKPLRHRTKETKVDANDSKELSNMPTSAFDDRLMSHAESNTVPDHPDIPFMAVAGARGATLAAAGKPVVQKGAAVSPSKGAAVSPSPTPAAGASPSQVAGGRTSPPPPGSPDAEAAKAAKLSALFGGKGAKGTSEASPDVPVVNGSPLVNGTPLAEVVCATTPPPDKKKLGMFSKAFAKEEPAAEAEAEHEDDPEHLAKVGHHRKNSMVKKGWKDNMRTKVLAAKLQAKVADFNQKKVESSEVKKQQQPP